VAQENLWRSAGSSSAVPPSICFFTRASQAIRRAVGRRPRSPPNVVPKADGRASGGGGWGEEGWFDQALTLQPAAPRGTRGSASQEGGAMPVVKNQAVDSLPWPAHRRAAARALRPDPLAAGNA